MGMPPSEGSPDNSPNSVDCNVADGRAGVWIMADHLAHEVVTMHKSPEILAFRANDACRALSLGRSTLYKLINEGKLKSITIAGRTLIPRTEIERLVSEASN